MIRSFNPMAKIVFPAIVFGLINIGITYAQQCDQCSHPRVALYDCDVQIPYPVNTTSADSVNNWFSLFWPAATAKDQFMNNDPTRDCITFYDGAMINAQTLQGDTVKVGPAYSNLPPSGEIESADYLIVSSVTGSGGNYTFTLQLQTAISREVVKSVSVGFTEETSSEKSAGLTAASAFIPLFQTIREFEVNKRNSDVTVAIRDLWTKDSPEDIIVNPQKTQVDTGETVDVDIEMIDCDGVPLENRQVFFCDTTVYDLPMNGSTGGEITPKVVTTDSYGKATVKFKAGHTKGYGRIIASYPHKKPCGRPDAFTGSAIVSIQPPPPDLWMMEMTILEEVSSHSDTSWSSELGSGSWQYESGSVGRTVIKAIVENIATEPGEFTFDTELWDPEAVTASGNASENSFQKYIDDGLLLRRGLTQADYWSGNIVPRGFSFNFYYTQDSKYAEASINFYRNGIEEGKSLDDDKTIVGDEDWVGFSDTISDSSGMIDVSGSSDDSGCSFAKSDSGFSAECSRTETTTDEWPSSRPVNTTMVLSVNVRPYGQLTGTRSEVNNNRIKSFALCQNYPNPFNPSTIINYQLPMSSHVTLNVYDVLGREVRTLVNEDKKIGSYEVKFDASNLPSGVYFYRLIAGTYTETKKCVLMK